MVADDIRAWDQTSRIGVAGIPDTYFGPDRLNPERKPKGHYYLVRYEGGPNNIEGDVFKTRRWTLVSGAGFHTMPHYDASGLCTFTLLPCGGKAWGFVLPPNRNATARDAWETYVEMAVNCDHVREESETLLPAMGCTVHNLLLTPGTLL